MKKRSLIISTGDDDDGVGVFGTKNIYIFPMMPWYLAINFGRPVLLLLSGETLTRCELLNSLHLLPTSLLQYLSLLFFLLILRRLLKSVHVFPGCLNIFAYFHAILEMYITGNKIENASNQSLCLRIYDEWKIMLWKCRTEAIYGLFKLSIFIQNDIFWSPHKPDGVDWIR